MLRLFLKLYFKSKLNKIFSYICLFLILVIVILSIESRFDIHPYSYLVIFVASVIFLFLYLEVKENRICIHLDTKLNQKKYYTEKGLEHFGKRKLNAGYRKWLLLTLTENNRDIVEIKSFVGSISNYFLYCYISIIPFTIITVFSTIYFTLLQTFVIVSVVFISIIALCILGDKRATKIKYKLLDSDIKRILFEEETGYSPLVKDDLTFKYKIWLKSKEVKKQTTPFRI